MKNLKYLLFILPFLFIGSVKAETIEFDYSNKYVSANSNQGFSYIDLDAFYSDYDDYSIEVEQLYQSVYDYYVTNYQEDYPYYFVSIIPFTNIGSDYIISSDIDDFSIHAALIPLKYVPTYSSFTNYVAIDNDDFFGINAAYDFSSSTYTLPFESVYGMSLSVTYNRNIFNSFPSFEYPYVYNPLVYYKSNFNLIFDLDDSYVVKEENSILHTFSNGDIIPTYYDSSGVVDNYVDVDLNNYPYIILSLKDYNQESFNALNYVKGQYCMTPVYDYGMTSKDDIIGSQVTDRCTVYYDSFTPVRVYILDSDLENHAIYYLKSYDTTKENIVRIDTSVFDIHYISEDEKDNPIIEVDGRKYSVIPFDDLPSTANKNEEENFAPGASEEFSFIDLFTSPIETLKDVWTSIDEVFNLIREFVYLLPQELAIFLYVSFCLALILGLIKILL